MQARLTKYRFFCSVLVKRLSTAKIASYMCDIRVERRRNLESKAYNL